MVLMVLVASQWFSVVLTGSRRFSVVLSRFSVVLSSSQYVLSSHRFSVVLHVGSLSGFQ